MADIVASRAPASIPFPPSPTVSSFGIDLPPSPPTTPFSTTHVLPSAADAFVGEGKGDLPLPPTFKMIPPTPLTPGEDDRFASPQLPSDAVLLADVDKPACAADGVELPASIQPMSPPNTPAKPDCESLLAPEPHDVVVHEQEDVPPPAPSSAVPFPATAPDHTSINHPAEPAASSRTLGRKISILNFSKRSPSPLPTSASRARAASPKPAVTVACGGTSIPPAALASVTTPAAAPPTVVKHAVEVAAASADKAGKKSSSSPSVGATSGLAGMFRSLTARKKPSLDGNKGSLLARGRSVLKSPKQIRLEKKAAEADALRTAERRHREASHLLGQPLRRSPSAPPAEPAQHAGIASHGEMQRSRSRDTALSGARAIGDAPVHPKQIPAQQIAGSAPSPRHMGESPGRHGSLPIVSELPVSDPPAEQPRSRTRPPALHIAIGSNGQQRPSGRSHSSSAGTPLSPDSDEAIYVRSRQKRLYEAVTTPPALSHSPASADGPSADYLSKIEARQTHQQSSPKTPADVTPCLHEFGSSAPDDIVGRRERLGKSFGSVNAATGHHMQHHTISRSKKRSSSTGPVIGGSLRARTSVSPQVMSRAEIAARVSQASEQDQHNVDTFFSM